MEYFIAPNGRYIAVPEDRVMTLGLNSMQNDCIRECLPTEDYELYDADVVTDVIALPVTIVIVCPSGLKPNELEILVDYYTEIEKHMDETVVWIGYPKPPNHLRSIFKCYQSFEELRVQIKYLLLTAHGKKKKSKEFSKKLADSITILSLIRQNPGIRTRELAERLELSDRTVQRYIATLQATGEWIEYNTNQRGWQLQHGISILFGDHLNN